MDLAFWSKLIKNRIIEIVCSAHLDQILVIFGQKVNIRLFYQKEDFFIFYHSHKCFGNLWSISKFFTSTSHKYDKTSSVVYICLMLKLVGHLPFAVGCLPSRNCLPDPTTKEFFAARGGRSPPSAVPPLNPLKNASVSLLSAAGEIFFWGFDSLSRFPFFPYKIIILLPRNHQFFYRYNFFSEIIINLWYKKWRLGSLFVCLGRKSGF